MNLKCDQRVTCLWNASLTICELWAAIQPVCEVSCKLWVIFRLWVGTRISLRYIRSALSIYTVVATGGVLWKKVFFKNFANITEKHLCCSLFLIKLQALRSATLSKRESKKVVFLWNLRNLKEHPFWRAFANNCFFPQYCKSPHNTK